MSLGERIATPDGKRRYVRTLFATIADRYDLITVLLSYGQDRRWKERLVRLAVSAEGTRALDLATGTGDLALSLASEGLGVVGLDITPRMIDLARAKAPDGARARFMVGDMLAMPFRDAAFDIVTTGYGLRNAPDLTAAITEIARVLRPRGRLLSLDFDKPSNKLVRSMYLAYLSFVGGALGWLLHRDPDTYRYISASLRTYPDRETLTRMMGACGFTVVKRHRVLGGLLAIHEATKAGM